MKKSFKSRVIALLKKDKVIEEVTDNSIIDKNKQYDTDVCSEINHLADTIVEHINAMTDKQVSYSNVNFLFKRDRTLEMFAITCIDTLEDEGIDSRDLSFAFSNSFSDHEREFNTPTKILLEDGKYIMDVPLIVIVRAMLWLTEQERKDSSFFSPNMDIGISQAALKSNSAFGVLLRGE